VFNQNPKPKAYEKSYIPLCSSLYCLYQSSASVYGGEITAQHIGGNDYAVTLSIYSDTLGTSATAIDVSDINGNHLFQIKCNYDSKLSVSMSSSEWGLCF